MIRYLKGLTEAIPLSIVKAFPKGDEHGWPGWRFPESDSEYPGATVDKLFGSEYLHDIYFKADKDYKGRYSVPVLWDTETNTIVNNESAEILRFMNNGFDDILDLEYKEKDFYPHDLRDEIDEISGWMSNDLNAGVYKAGFAPNQECYDKSVVSVFEALNRMEKIIYSNGGPYVLGKTMTELDLRLYPTIIRFDVVYVQHFKCNLGTIRHNYPILHNWLKTLYWNVPGFRETTDFKHIKENVSRARRSRTF